METRQLAILKNRRNFLLKCFTAGSAVCFGCLGSSLTANNLADTKILPQDSLKNEELFRFALGYTLPLMKKMQANMGKMPFLELLEKSAEANMADKMSVLSKDIKDRSMKKFGELILQLHSTSPVKEGIKVEVTEQSEKVFEMKVTECLMAKVYKELNANTIGYAIECHPSDAIVKAFNPNAKCTKSKNMMIGDPYCVERFELA
jgi:hypothetical protein